MYLLNLGQKLQRYLANLSLAEGALDIGEHIQIARSLTMELCTGVVKTVLAFEEVGVEYLWIFEVLQAVKVLL